MSAFPFDAVIFDMDGVLVDTEFYYQKELEKFIDYLQISVTRDELNAIVGSSHRDFQRVLVDWHERAGLGKLSVEAAEAKLIAARTASDVTRRCLQLFGGYGYTRDYPIERMMRDAKITEIYEGTSEVQMMVISGALLK